MFIVNAKFKLKRTRSQQKARKKGRGNPKKDKEINTNNTLRKTDYNNPLIFHSIKEKIEFTKE